MAKYIVRRLLLMLVTMLAASLLIFVVFFVKIARSKVLIINISIILYWV